MLSLSVITLAYIIGILWGLYLELNTLIITSIFLFLYLLTFTDKFKIYFLVVIMMCIFGCCYTTNEIRKYDNKYSDNQILNLNVTITTPCVEQDYIYKYNCKSKTGDRFILYFSKNIGNQFQIGECLKITGKFNLPDVARNRGGFNYRRYLNSNGYYGQIKVDSFENIEKDILLINSVYSVQNYINNTFKKYLSKNFAGILSGMIIGETSNISDETKLEFQNSGITHLLAVSGSNVATVIVFSNYLVVKLFGKKYSDYISIIFILFFILIARCFVIGSKSGYNGYIDTGSQYFKQKK